MPVDNIIYEKVHGVAKITINRPEVMNALRPVDLFEAKAAIECAEKDDSVGVIVLTGAGGAFCAGVDLKALRECKLKGGRVGTQLDNAARDFIETIETVSKVVIAMVNGYCITGGLEIALACDFIIAADTHVRWGLRCIWGMSQRLPRRIGWMKAKELTFTAKMITAREALCINMINMVVIPEKLDETVNDLSKKIMNNSLSAIAAHKYLYNHSMLDTLENGLHLEAKTDFVIADTEERLARFK